MSQNIRNQYHQFMVEKIFLAQKILAQILLAEVPQYKYSW